MMPGSFGVPTNQAAQPAMNTAFPAMNLTAPNANPAPNQKPGTAEHMMGTSIVAISFDGGVVMGADSRTSTGYYVANRVSDKISQVADRIYCCRSGSAADTQAITGIVKYYLDIHRIELETQPLVKTAAHLFRDMCYQNKNRLMAGIICAGWDEQGGGQVYSIPLGGALVKQDFAIGGSGSTFIYGYCDAHYKKNMTAEECEKFTKNCLAHAMARDGSSGGVIRLKTITKEGVKISYVKGDELPYNLA